MADPCRTKLMEEQMKKYLKTLRVQHYMKNGLVCCAPFFSQTLSQPDIIKNIILSILAFSFISSSIYIINDIHDVEKDKRHPTKCKRPIASGEIPIAQAKRICAVLIFLSALFQYLVEGKNLAAWAILCIYFLINIVYSVYGAKDKPLIDVCLLASGFILRVFYGAANTHVDISVWLLLVITSGSLFMGFGKRRNELVSSGDRTREVLRFYNKNFLSQSMGVTMTLSIVFYALWCMEKDAVESIQRFTYTVPIVMIILLRYSFIIESDHDGDPVNVLTGDRVLLSLCIAYIVALCWFIYLV